MEFFPKAAGLAAAALLVFTFGVPAPAAASGCGELCNGNFCEPVLNHDDWGCMQSASVCYDYLCPGGWGLTTGLVDQVAAAAEAGDLPKARELAAKYPSLRIFKSGKLVFDGPQLAGIPGPESSPEVVRAACATAAPAAASLEATPAPQAQPAPAAAPQPD